MIANKANRKRLLGNQKTNLQKIFSRHCLVICSCAVLMLVGGCSGGSGGGDDGNDSVNSSSTSGAAVTGYAVKGPLKNATVSLYSIDLSAADLKGRLLDTGETNESGSITNLNAPGLVKGPFLLEVTGGKELDGSNPVIPTLRTVVRADQIANTAASTTKTPIVVTPLTTLVTEMARASAARKNSSASGTVTLDNFFTQSNGGEIGTQTGVVKAALGLGLLSGINIFTDAPIITGSNDAATALRYRTAIEVNAALFVQILNAVGTGNADAVFAAYAQDLSDKVIDGAAAGVSLPALSGHITQITNILSQQPSALMALTIPGVTPSQTIAQLNTVLAQQAGVNVIPAVLTITKSTVVAPDSDGDGRIDSLDKFLNNRNEWADTDNDCATAPAFASTSADSTTGGNGCGDNSDNEPNNPAVQTPCQLPGADPEIPIANAGLSNTNDFKYSHNDNGDDTTNREVTLDGIGSCDPNGEEYTYQWTVVSVPTVLGPNGTQLELLGKKGNGLDTVITKQNLLSAYNVQKPTFQANFAGDYVFSLVVTDSSGHASAPSVVTKTITKDYYVNFDGKAMFLSSLAALLLLAVPAKMRKRKLNS